MKLYGYNITFINCSPDDKVRAALREMAGRLKFKAPSNSRIRIALEKNQDIYSGHCRVGSMAGIFVSRAEHPNPLTCIKMMEQDANEKLHAWDLQRQTYLKTFCNNFPKVTQDFLAIQNDTPTSDAS